MEESWKVSKHIESFQVNSKKIRLESVARDDPINSIELQLAKQVQTLSEIQFQPGGQRNLSIVLNWRSVANRPFTMCWRSAINWNGSDYGAQKNEESRWNHRVRFMLNRFTFLPSATIGRVNPFL